MLKEAIQSLIALGMSETQIATALSVSQPTVNRIRNGKQKASFDLGQRILQLQSDAAAKRDQDKRDQVAA